MHKHLTAIFGSAFAAAALVGGAAQAQAAEMLVNGQEVFANVEYDCPPDGNFGFYFVPAETGKATYWMGSAYTAYSDAEHTQMMDWDFLNYDHSGTVQIDVTEGETVYFYATWPNYYGTGPFQILMGAPLEVTKTYPEAGDVIGVSGYGAVDIWFNQKGMAEKLTVSVGDVESTLSVPKAPATSISTNYTGLFNTWYANGTLKGGETVTFTYTGLQNEEGKLYNGDGVYSVSFEAAPEPIYLLSDTMPETIKSYYLPGDPEGIFTYTFSGDLGSARCAFGYGNREGEVGDFYIEYIDGVIVGNMAIFDLCGVQRRPKDMVNGGFLYSTCEMQVWFTDTTGQPVASPGQGTLGSWAYRPGYEYIKPAVFAPTYVPAAGSMLTSETIKIELSDYDQIRYDSVLFSYANGQSYTVPAAEVAVSTVSGITTMTVPVPAEVLGSQDRVTVTLAGLLTADGEDHSNDIRVVYNGFTLTSFELYDAEGLLITDRALYEMPEDAVINITTSLDNPELYIEYQIVDVTTDEIVKSFYEMTYGEDAFGDPVFKATIPFAVKMNYGHTYHVVFDAWTDVWAKRNGEASIGSEYVAFEGLTPPFKFSNIHLVSVNPAEGTPIPADQRDFVFDFEGPVTIDAEKSFINIGMGMTMPYEAITITGDDIFGYSSQWTVTIPEGFIASYGIDILNVVVKAYDGNGDLVEGNFGVEENSHFYFEYPVEGAGYCDNMIWTPADGAEVDELSTFTVKVEGQKVGLNYNEAGQSIVLMNMDGGAIQEWFMNDMEIKSENPDDLDANTYVEFSLDKPITLAGKYVMYVPEKIFIVGEQFTTSYSPEFWLTFTVEGEVVGDTPNITPAPGKIESLSDFTLNYSDLMPSWNGVATLSLPNGEELSLNGNAFEMVLADPSNEMSDILGQRCVLPETYTEDGDYVLSIPAGMFVMADYSNSPAWTVTWTIGEGGGSDIPDVPGIPDGLEITPAEGVITELPGFSLHCYGLEIAYDNWEEEITLFLPSGEVVYVDRNMMAPIEDPNAMNWWDPYLGLTYEFDHPFTQPGEYTLYVPDGTLEIAAGWDYIPVPAFKVVWTIEGTANTSVYVLPDPKEELAELAWFSINSYNDENLEPNYDNWELAATLTYPDGEGMLIRNYQFEPVNADPSDWNSAYISQVYTFKEPLTAKGAYKLEIPAGFFNLGWDFDVVEVDAITVVWTVGDNVGVSGAFAETEFNVFTVDGKVVLTNGTAAQLDELGAGLYIINGKKVMLRK